MPVWTVQKKWNDQDVFVVGGGNSLREFNWSLLRDENVIACNQAYEHGVDIIDICIFGDEPWFDDNKAGLAKYVEQGGTVCTNCIHLYRKGPRWLWTFDRKLNGACKRGYLSWNFNTGAAAVNLAAQLGARRIFLLGFDMMNRDGKSNWHDRYKTKTDEAAYKKFVQGFKRLHNGLERNFKVEVLNITDASNLCIFDKIPVDEFWSDRYGSDYKHISSRDNQSSDRL